MSSELSTRSMLLGALVADAASLGVHWIYDPKRIEEIAAHRDGQTSFTPIDAHNFEGVPAYFAHGARSDGDLSQYGEVLWLAIGSILTEHGFDVAAYQESFAAHFGPGGAFVGYIDRPTGGTLENIAGEVLAPSGIDDDQLPATARLPAIMAVYSGKSNAMDMVKAAMEVTNVNDVAWAYSEVFAGLIDRLLGGAELQSALKAAADRADPSIRETLVQALETPEISSTNYAEVNGRACHLPMAAPLIFHILKHSQSYREAVERNNLAGGDSAGRSILIGAIMGLIHGRDEVLGIPLEWVLMLNNSAEIWDGCRALDAMKV